MTDWPRIAATARRVVLFAALLYPAGLAIYLNLMQPGASAMPIDFAAFWGAARLAADGAAGAAFDWQSLHGMMNFPPGAEDAFFRWMYPAHYLLLVAPIGWLGFTPALALFTLAGLAAFWLALKPWSAENPALRDLVIASPAVVATAFAGNTSLLWMAAFLAAMHFRATSRPMLAGLCIALLTCKPQLGPIIAVALLAARDWRLIAWSAGFTLALAGLATLVYGVAYWQAFLEAIDASREIVAQSDMQSQRMITWFAFARQHFGAGQTPYLVQAGFTGVAAFCAVLLWAKPAIPRDLRIAGLLLAILTGAVYAFQYETLLSTVAILFLARAGAARTAPGRAWLALLWLLPLPHRIFTDLIVAQYAAPVIALSLAICMAMALRRVPAQQ